MGCFDELSQLHRVRLLPSQVGPTILGQRQPLRAIRVGLRKGPAPQEMHSGTALPQGLAAGAGNLLALKDIFPEPVQVSGRPEGFSW